MEHIFNPDLLRAAATSALGFVSLGLMLLSAIALVFFRNSSDVIKMVMFVLLIISVFVFGYLLVKNKSASDLKVSGSADTTREIEDTSSTLLQSMFIPSNKSVATLSSFTLKNGIEYELEVSGTFQANDKIEADVDYSISTDVEGDSWTDVVSGYEEEGDTLLDLKVIGFNSLNWGALNPDHTYRVAITGAGEPLQLLIHDVYYQNNTGGLTVNIYCKKEC